MKNRYLLILNIVLAVLALWMMKHDSLTDYYTLNGDARLLFYINNFEDNLKTNFLSQAAYSKMLSGATVYLSNFYVIANKFVDFLFIAKLMPILSFLASAILIYKFGKLIKDKKYGLIAAFLFILHPLSIRPFDDGMSRAFIFPLLIAFLYYFVKKEILKLSVVLLFQAMLYPPAFLISALTFGISLVDIKRKGINLDIKKNYPVYTSMLASILLIIVPMVFLNYGIKERTPFDEAILYPEFYDDGKVPVFRGNIPFTSDIKSTIQTLIVIYDTGIHRPLLANGLFILLLLTIISVLYFKRKILANIPKEVYFMLISGFVLQSLAALLLFRLHLPSRYVRYPLPLVLMLILAYGIYLLSKDRKTMPVFVGLLILLPIFYIPKIDYMPVHCQDKEVYGYLKTLPKSALVAGHPTDMNCMALFGQIKPFIMSELNTPYYKDYYEIVRKRNLDFFSAYYSDSRLKVQNFCKDNSITHLIVNKEHFDEGFLNKRRIFYEPFNSYIKNITKNRKDFYLQKPDNVLFESGNKIVISCGS